MVNNVVPTLIDGAPANVIDEGQAFVLSNSGQHGTTISASAGRIPVSTTRPTHNTPPNGGEKF